MMMPLSWRVFLAFDDIHEDLDLFSEVFDFNDVGISEFRSWKARWC